MTEEERDNIIDQLRLGANMMAEREQQRNAIRALPTDWPHDPRRAPLDQPSDEQLAQAMQAFSGHPEPFEETVERIGKAVAEDVDDLHPELPTVVSTTADPCFCADFHMCRHRTTAEREEFSEWLKREDLEEER